jgi:hypothetical protein
MYRNWTKEQRQELAIAAMKSVSSEQEYYGDTMPDVNDNMSDTDLEKTLSVPNDTSLTLFDGDGFIGINRPSVGIYVQRNRPQKATDSPLSGYEEVIHDLCDHIRILERKAAEAQSLCNRWMKTALDMAPLGTMGMVILPNNPEAFAMSRASVIHQLESQLSEARQKAIKECVTVLERREAEHLKNYRGGSDVAADYLHEIEQCTEALRALLKEKP